MLIEISKYQAEEIKHGNHTTLYPYEEVDINVGESYLLFYDDDMNLYRVRLSKADEVGELEDYDTMLAATFIVKLKHC